VELSWLLGHCMAVNSIYKILRCSHNPEIRAAGRKTKGKQGVFLLTKRSEDVTGTTEFKELWIQSTDFICSNNLGGLNLCIFADPVINNSIHASISPQSREVEDMTSPYQS
jgi:hypothetical protein